MTHSHPTRRDVVNGGAAALGATALSGPAVRALAATPAAAAVTGVVFEDHDGSGRRPDGAAGIAGVMVSNGRDVAITDAEGRYRLPIEDGMVVFVVKPTGFGVPIDPHTMLPRFYYVHAPNGSPAGLDFRYRGLAPTGPLPAQVDFGLRRQDEPQTFDVVLFTDPQPESETEIDFIRDAIVDGVVGTKAAFGITAGDIMFDDLSMYPRYLRILAQVGIPWYNIGGNHDLNYEAPDRRLSRETFKRFFGPPAYAFEYGGALFLMLDNVEYLGPDPTKPRLGGKYRGHIGEGQLAFVANVLAHTPKDRLVVAVMHIPLRSYVDAKETSNDTIDAPAFVRLLAERPSVSFAGHTHTTEHHYLATGASADRLADAAAGHHHHVMTAVSGSWWSGPFDRFGIAAADSRDGTPNGYHVLSVDKGRYTTRFQAARSPADHQMRITLDWAHHSARKELTTEFRVGQLLGSPIDQENVFATSLLVNVFDGGPKTTVSYRVGGRAPIAMTLTRRPDPFVQEVYARNAATKKPWVEAEASSHIWTARLPADLPSGTHRVEVTAIDEYGRELRDRLIVEVRGDGGEVAPTGRPG